MAYCRGCGSTPIEEGRVRMWHATTRDTGGCREEGTDKDNLPPPPGGVGALPLPPLPAPLLILFALTCVP